MWMATHWEAPNVRYREITCNWLWVKQDHQRWRYSTVIHLDQSVYLAIKERFEHREKKRTKKKDWTIEKGRMVEDFPFLLPTFCSLHCDSFWVSLYTMSTYRCNHSSNHPSFILWSHICSHYVLKSLLPLSSRTMVSYWPIIATPEIYMCQVWSYWHHNSD